MGLNELRAIIRGGNSHNFIYYRISIKYVVTYCNFYVFMPYHQSRCVILGCSQHLWVNVKDTTHL